jgi:hypothetical protein
MNGLEWNGVPVPVAVPVEAPVLDIGSVNGTGDMRAGWGAAAEDPAEGSLELPGSASLQAEGNIFISYI